MSLDVPTLDDREYADLLADLRKRIPVYAPEWTDHNVHDPGITVLELLTWLAETYQYQLDQVTDSHRLKYLALLGTRPEPPRPATVRLGLQGTPGTTVPAHEPLVFEDETTRRWYFQTSEAVTLTGAAVERVATAAGGERVDHTEANRRPGMYFEPFGPAATRGSAVYLGLDGDPFAAAETLALAVDYHDDDLPPVGAHEPTDPPFVPTVELDWQFCTDYGNWRDDDAWTPFKVVADTTASLYFDGTIRLARPDSGWAPDERDRSETVCGQSGESVWIRGVVVTPGYEIPPRLNSIRLDVVRAEQRVRRPPAVLHRAEPVETGTDRWTTTAHPGQTFAFEHRPVLDARLVVVTPATVDALRRTQADEDAADDPLETEPSDTTEWLVEHVQRVAERLGEEAAEWRATDDFDAAGPDDRVYVLDAERGTVTFGDGVHGAVPEPGGAVVAVWYDHGGGRAGNVSVREPADTGESERRRTDRDDGPSRGRGRWRFDRPGARGGEFTDVSVKPLESATGGADAETLDDAFARVRRDLRSTRRAVTTADYRELALATPGTRFGRATARVHQRPAGGDDGQVVDVVRVVVVPHARPEVGRGTDDGRTAALATPSRGFLQSVRRHVDRHRLLTDRVEVVGPTYVRLSVGADVQVVSGFSNAERSRVIADELDRFLDPLEGFDGEGWPFGRPVYKSELYEVIKGVDGVDYVADVWIEAAGEATRDEDGNVVIGDEALVDPVDHHIVVRGGSGS